MIRETLVDMSFFALGKEQADTTKKMCMSETSPGRQE
jgi:hypothetical protein